MNAIRWTHEQYEAFRQKQAPARAAGSLVPPSVALAPDEAVASSAAGFGACVRRDGRLFSDRPARLPGPGLLVGVERSGIAGAIEEAPEDGRIPAVAWLAGSGPRSAGKKKGRRAGKGGCPAGRADGRGRSLPHDPFPAMTDFLGADFLGEPLGEPSDPMSLAPLILRYGTALLASAAHAIEIGVVRRPATEYDDQVLVFRFLERLAQRFPVDLGEEILDIFSTSSGGKRHRGAAGQLKLAGQRRGVPDIEAWCPRIAPDGLIQHGLAIEMKRTPSKGVSRGRSTPEQRERIKRLRQRGYQAEILYGWRPTCVALLRYLTLRRP